MTDDLSDDELLAALGASPEPKSKSSRTPREARIIAGFEDIVRFVEEHDRLPQHGADRDIFERIYATRLDALRKQPESRTLLAPLDKGGLLASLEANKDSTDIDDDELLKALGVGTGDGSDDISELRHVRPRAEIRAAEDVANRQVCDDFALFKPLFDQVQQELNSGVRQTRAFELKSEIEPGRFFVVAGQKAYVAGKGDVFTNDQGRLDARLRVIFDNGVESNMLMRSLQRALHKDDAGRRITDPSAGPLFGGNAEQDDLESGLIYVLRSLSDHPEIAGRRNVVHKIGVTGNDLKTRVANAKNEATYLLAGVEVAATYRLYNINRTKLENLIHRVFSTARLDLEIKDRFGNPVHPREWFLVPLSTIDRAVELIQSGEIEAWTYNPETASFDARVD